MYLDRAGTPPPPRRKHPLGPTVRAAQEANFLEIQFAIDSGFAATQALFLSSIEIQFHDRIPVGGPTKFSCHQLNLAFPITLL